MKKNSKDNTERKVLLEESLVHVTGDPKTAMILAQMLYWDPRSTKPGGWVQKSADELSDEICGLWKEGKVGKLLQKLVDQNLLYRKYDNIPTRRAYLYRPNHEEIKKRLESFTPAPKRAYSQPNRTLTEEECTPTPEECIPTGDEYNREYVTENTEPENNLMPHRIRREPHSVRSDDQCSLDGETDGLPSKPFMDAVDLAVQQNFEMVRAKLWRKLDSDLAKQKSVAEAFGDNPCIPWTRTETGFLQEIIDFCRDQWSDIDPVITTAGIIRSSFRRDGKSFQILKHWIKHCKRRPSLRPYLTLAGGIKDPSRRLDLLKEIADSEGMSELIQRHRPTGEIKTTALDIQ